MVFFDLQGNLFLEIFFGNALLTSWSPLQFNMGPTATIQDSELVDEGIVFNPGEELIKILEESGFPVELLGVGEEFAFTLTNFRNQDQEPPAPFLPPLSDGGGQWLEEWMADGSFSATAGE